MTVLRISDLRLTLAAFVVAGHALTAQRAAQIIAAPAVELAADDVAQITAAAHAVVDRDVWLIAAMGRQACCGWNAQAYALPERSGRDLRRGRSVNLSAGGSDRSFRTQPRTWVVSRDARSNEPTVRSYAQVALPGRDFDDVQGLADENRPFGVSGEIDDETLISMVRFLRSEPSTGATAGMSLPPRPWAIGNVAVIGDLASELASRGRGGSSLTGPGMRIVLNLTPTSGVLVTLQRANATWVIRGVGAFAA